jgi:leucyl/phenylalanyl-tRNA--protein transferase
MPRARASRLPVLAASPGPFSGLPLVAREDLVAAGGEPEPELLLHAYRHGVFPWYSDPGRPLWWCPDPRAVLPLDALHVPSRLERSLRSGRWRLSEDERFEAVMRACGEERADGTWIHPEMVPGYVALFRRGHAHSFEVWQGRRLVGGLYGVAVPPVFCAESKFHRARDASKAALVFACRALAARGFTHLEVQFLTPHLAQFGVREISRAAYLDLFRSTAEGARRTRD